MFPSTRPVLEVNLIILGVQMSFWQNDIVTKIYHLKQLDFSVISQSLRFFSVLIDVKLDKISPQLLLWCQTLEVASRVFPFGSSCWFCRGLIPHNFEKRTSKVILPRNLTKKSPPMTPQRDGCQWTWLNPLVLYLFGKYQPQDAGWVDEFFLNRENWANPPPCDSGKWRSVLAGS